MAAIRPDTMIDTPCLDRRALLLGGASLIAGAAAARANVFVPGPPVETRAEFVGWMAQNRREDAAFLGQRWDRYKELVAKKDLWGQREIRGYLMTPREEFVTAANLNRAYEWHYLNIGYGVTITGPHTVARMTNSLDVQPDDKVLEIGTGSGYQSAYLSNLTGKVWSIEIIKPLAERTRAIYDKLIARGYDEYRAITTKNADGYYGWESEAPFDKIIVTCGIDHIPPPLMQQLSPNGIMLIPVGPPGAQHVLKIVKKREADGAIVTTRSDIYNGGRLSWVPFTKLDGGVIKGRHTAR
jgi:protein-L-isoaspartate(D-aspartate) O-methyltransferase